MFANHQGVRRIENEITNGHDVEFLLPVRNLVALDSGPFILEHYNNCSNFPTSWKLRIAYEQVPDNGKVSCKVSLHRTDQNSSFVYVSVSVSYLNNSGIVLLLPELVCDGQMFSNGEIEGYLEDFRHPGYRSHIFSLSLVLRLTLSIRYCHTAVKIYAKATVDRNENRMQKSKL